MKKTAVKKTTKKDGGKKKGVAVKKVSGTAASRRRTKRKAGFFSTHYHKILSSVLVLVVAILIWQIGIPKPVRRLVMPDPKVVQVDVDAVSAGIRKSDYCYNVAAEIVNNGRAGNVVFEVTLLQGKAKWKKTARLRLGSGEMKIFELSFKEVIFKGPKPGIDFKSYGEIF